MIDATSYNISIRKANVDGVECFEAKVIELPDVAEYADSFEEAYRLALDTIETTAKIFEQKDKVMPSPAIPLGDYSGRITLRMSKTLHRYLALHSEREGVSLNQYIVDQLNFCRGYKLCGMEKDKSWPVYFEQSVEVSSSYKRQRKCDVVSIKKSELGGYG